MIHSNDELGQKDFIHIPNAPSPHSPDPLVLLDHQSSLNCPLLRIVILTNPPLNNPPLPPLQLAFKCDDQTRMTTSFSTTCNCRAPRTTLSISTAATTDYCNVTDANNTDTLNKTAIPRYGRSYSARFASGRKLLKITVRISTCHQWPLKHSEATSLTTRTFKNPENSDY